MMYGLCVANTRVGNSRLPPTEVEVVPARAVVDGEPPPPRPRLLTVSVPDSTAWTDHQSTCGRVHPTRHRDVAVCL